MRDLALLSSEVLSEWAKEECRHLDLIASWETLMNVYETLGFIGPKTDEERLTEFKVIIGELNKFLTRMKNGLDRTSSIEGAIEFLQGHINTADMNTVKNRQGIAYNKLKQRWITQAISTLITTLQQEIEEEEKEDES